MKKIQIAAVAAGLLILAGCGAQNSQQAPNSQESTAQTPQSSGLPGQGGIINSIKSAMGLSKTMKCTYVDPQNNNATETVYVNGQKFRSDMAIENDTSHAVFDGSTMYSWSDKTKQGMKITKACSDELNKQTAQNQNNTEQTPNVTKEEESFDSATNVSCVDASGVDFSAPSGVNFVDECEMLKNFQKNIQSNVNIPKNISNIPSNMPSNIPSNLP